jgi:5-methylcytosine-specific restriction enzyme A
MPMKQRRPCAFSGCSALVDSGYCQAHLQYKPVQRQPDKRPNSNARGYDRHWRIIRAQFLKFHPVCVTKSCGAPAKHVDHVIPLEGGGTNQWENLQPLCPSCHSRKTATQDGGFGNNKGELWH